MAASVGAGWCAGPPHNVCRGLKEGRRNAVGIPVGVVDQQRVDRRPGVVLETNLGASGGFRSLLAPARLAGGPGGGTVPPSVLRPARVGVGLCRPAVRGGTAATAASLALCLVAIRAGIPRRPDELHAPPGPQTLPMRGTPRTPLSMTIADLTTVVGPPPPNEVIDLDLWGWGAALADRHQPDPVASSQCIDTSCADGAAFPCIGSRTAERLLDASRGPWPHRWTARLDALSCGLDRLRASPPARSRPTATEQSAAGEAPGDGVRSRAISRRSHLAVSLRDSHRSGGLPADKEAVLS